MDIEQSYQDATVVPPTSVALLVSADGDVTLVIPKNEEQKWHSTQVALAQLAVRFLNDPEWVQEMAEELKASAS